jgi:hypothetical protein
MATITDDQRLVLKCLHRYPGISIRGIARQAGWVSDAGSPNIAKVQRALQALAQAGLAQQADILLPTAKGLERIR